MAPEIFFRRTAAVLQRVPRRHVAGGTAPARAAGSGEIHAGGSPPPRGQTGHYLFLADRRPGRDRFLRAGEPRRAIYRAAKPVHRYQYPGENRAGGVVRQRSMLMKSLLICPAERQTVAALAERSPLALVPLLGKTLVDYWLEHLVERGAKEVVILSDDRADEIAAHVDDGARWGLKATVQHEAAERTVAEARAKYRAADDTPWLPAPEDVIFMDRLPQQPESPLFNSYASWFGAGTDWLMHAATPDRVGVHVLKLGVWAGLHTRIAPTAELHAPVWIGDNVYIGDGAVVGPNVIIEERAFIEPRAIV